ncbi:MAG TPA: VOC family protein [Acidimicrobiales bacterium]|jgi:predicted enzyme related to lactoylglutathione lyase|nr:VOC family protein [Acidimicrobiales bacterium]
MTHRSRLTAALVDVPAEHYQSSVDFWSGALGRTAEPDEDDPEYTLLSGPDQGLSMIVQRVDDAARVHLDIETDDVDAEVRRLEALGAVRVRQVKTWWILRDPAGLLFCVVRVQRPEEFATQATEWPD